MPPGSPATTDYRTAFEQAPIGLVLSRQRLIVDCNRQLQAMFRAGREALVGRSFEVLYPSPDEFEAPGCASSRSSTPRAATPTSA